MNNVPTLALLALLLPAMAACAAGGSAPEYLVTPGTSDELPFSHVVLTDDLCFVAGSLGLDPDTGRAPADVEREARLMLDSFRAKLELVGLGMDDLVSVQVFCSDVAHYDVFNRVYRTYFTGPFPARAFVGSGALLRGCRFEITGIAAR